MTDWEQNYQDGHTPWNKGLPSPPMLEWVLQNRPQGRALIPGCGVGHDVAMLVEKGLDAYGLDIAPTAIAMAHAAYLDQKNRFVLGDLFATSAEWQGSFDYLFEHTCLCALPPEWRTRYETAAHQLLKPGGQIVGIWFINPEMDPDESGPPFGISVSELSTLFDESRWQVIEDRVPDVGYDGRVGRERLRVMRKKG
jgi:SAM-dependent methyltransferase